MHSFGHSCCCTDVDQPLDIVLTDELRQVVIDHVTRILEGDEWRGLEQACLVLGSLDHEPAAGRLSVR